MLFCTILFASTIFVFANNNDSTLMDNTALQTQIMQINISELNQSNETNSSSSPIVDNNLSNISEFNQSEDTNLSSSPITDSNGSDILSELNQSNNGDDTSIPTQESSEAINTTENIPKVEYTNISNQNITHNIITEYIIKGKKAERIELTQEELKKQYFISPITEKKYEIIKNEEGISFKDIESNEIFKNQEDILKKESTTKDKIQLKLDNNLLDIYNENNNSSELVNVVITLKEQPSSSDIEDIKKKYEEEHKTKENQIKDILKEYQKKVTDPVKEGKKVSELKQDSIKKSDKDKIKKYGEEIEALDKKLKDEIKSKISPKIKSDQQSVIDLITSVGGTILYQDDNFNALSATVPINTLGVLSEDKKIDSIIYDYKKYQPTLDVSVPSIYAPTWWSAGYEGSWSSGIDVAVVDTGIDESHPNLYATSESYVRTFENYDPSGSGTYDDNVGHGTHVAGIIASSDSTYTGVAPGIYKLLNVKILGEGPLAGRDSTIMNGLSWATTSAPDTAEVLSNSWGSPYKDSRYGCIIGTKPNGESPLTRYIDAITSNYNINTIFAVGNDGTCGDISLGTPGDAYNTITVGSINDQSTTSRTDDTIATLSSKGPTYDGRKKPDLVAPGGDCIFSGNDCMSYLNPIISTNSNWEGLNPNFIGKSGTSMAAPHVSGAAALTTQYGLTPLETKALLINTAEDKGTFGWDNEYGWGYLDLNRAYNYVPYTFQDAVTQGGYKFYKVGLVLNGERATLTWNRHINYNGINYPTQVYNLNDLDLYYYNEADNSVMAVSTAIKDNVEQVKSPAQYNNLVLKIDAYTQTFYHGSSTETYGLSTEGGYIWVIGPLFSSRLNLPNQVNNTFLFQINATVNNTGDLNGHDVNIQLNLPAGLTIISGANPQSLGMIANWTSKTATWDVQAVGVGTYNNIYASYTSNSYGESYAGNTSKYSVMVVDTIPPNITINSPLNKTWYFSSAVSLNATLNEIGKWINVSVDGGLAQNKCTGCNATFYNITSLSQGNHTITVYASDYSNNIANMTYIFYVDTIYPSIITKKPSNGSIVLSKDDVNFSINYTEANLDHITIFWNTSTANWTNNNLTNCSSGTNKQCSISMNLCSSYDDTYISYYFGIFEKSGRSAYNVPPPTFRLICDYVPPYFNPTPTDQNITYNQPFLYQVNASDNVNINTYWLNDTTQFSIDSNGLISNKTALAAGTYNLNISVNDTSNNINSTVITVNVNQATPILTLNSVNGWNKIYGNSSSVNCTPSTTQAIPKLYRNEINVSNPHIGTFDAGNYIYTCNSTATQNYTAGFATNNLTIDEIADTIRLYINGIESNKTLTVGKVSNVTATSSSGTVQLYRDDVLVTNPEIATLGVDVYEYRANSTGNTNYNADSIGKVLYVTVSKVASNLSLKLNGNLNNITVQVGQNITIIANRTLGDGLIELYDEGSLIGNGTNVQTIISYASIGLKNITAAYNETVNYSRYSVTYWVNVVDTKNPTVTIISPMSMVYNTTSILVNISANDNSEISTIRYNWNGTNVTYIIPTIETFKEGNITLITYVNDTTNNKNSTSVKFTIDTTSPITNLSGVIEGTYYNKNKTLTLTRKDAVSGIKYTSYKIDSGIWTNGTSFTVSGNGQHVAYYYSVDNAGNMETAKNVSFTIDYINPKINSINLSRNITQSGAKVFVIVNATDNIGITYVRAEGTNLIQDGDLWYNNITLSSPPLDIVVSDLANNTITNSTITYTIDAKAPVITNAKANVTYAKSTTPINFSATVTDASLQSVEINGTTMNGPLPNGGLFSTINSTSNFGCQNIEGNCTLTIIATDSLGNNNTAKITVKIDDIAPRVRNITIINKTAYARSTEQVTIKVNVSDANISSVKIGNIPLSLSAGLYSKTTNLSALGCLPNQLCSLTINATDKLGNINNTEQKQIYIDDLKPLVFAQGINETGTLGIKKPIKIYANVTDDQNVSSVKVQYGLNPVLSLINEEGDLWSKAITLSDLGITASGNATIKFIAYDLAGNINNTQAIVVSADSAIPKLTVSSPKINTYQNISTIILNYTVNDTNFDYTNIRLYNSTGEVTEEQNRTGTGKYNLNFTGLNDDKYNLVLNAYDLVGNMVQTNITNIVIDTVAPEIIINYPLNNSLITSTLKLNITVNDPIFSNVTAILLKGNTKVATKTSKINGTSILSFTSIPLGNYNISITAYDKAKNKNLVYISNLTRI